MNSQNLGSNHQSTKLQNRALVLKIICTNTDMSRIDISRQTGLSKMSITNIVNELISQGYVTENCDLQDTSRTSSIGRRPVYLYPDTVKHLSLGIYISRDFAVATLVNLKCEIIAEEKCLFSSKESENTFTEKILGIIRAILSKHPDAAEKVIGIGVACIGPLDVNKGIILDPPNFHQLKSIPVKQLLEKEFGYPVYLDNDMNASALAEKLYGKGKDLRDFIYLGVTNGIGAGIIANDMLFAGDMGFSGEIGHTTINFEGPRCACGNTGCLELYASIPEIVAQTKNAISLGMKSTLSKLDSFNWSDIVGEARIGDELSVKIIDRLCCYISIALISLINIFDTRSIFLGHDIAKAGDMVTERIREYIKDKTISSRYKDVSIEISAFGENTPVAGSAAIIFDKLFSGEIASSW